jgi:hypothetical protein
MIEGGRVGQDKIEQRLMLRVARLPKSHRQMGWEKITPKGGKGEGVTRLLSPAAITDFIVPLLKIITHYYR